MKKKMTAFVALVMAVVVTASSVSGTYAKYTTNDSFTDNARVAKWGFKISGDKDTAAGNVVNLFHDSYIVGGTVATGAADEETIVKGDAAVVAPGTKGEYTFNIAGTPEVNYTLDVKAEGEITNDTDAKDLENSLVFSLTKNGTELLTTGTTFTDLKNAINNLYKKASSTDKEVYAANYATNDTYKISWEWTLGTSDDSTDAKNVIDTKLGDLAAEGKSPEVSLTVTINAIQSELQATVK